MIEKFNSDSPRLKFQVTNVVIARIYFPDYPLIKQLEASQSETLQKRPLKIIQKKLHRAELKDPENQKLLINLSTSSLLKA